MALLVISYSRQDQRIVRAVVTLLQGALRDTVQKAVFWDSDLEPGEPWFEQIKSHIDAAPQLFVFWCFHSSASPQVRREVMYALESRRRVVPVLLDGTPLPTELVHIHGIDLRGAIKHSRRRAERERPPRKGGGGVGSHGYMTREQLEKYGYAKPAPIEPESHAGGLGLLMVGLLVAGVLGLLLWLFWSPLLRIAAAVWERTSYETLQEILSATLALFGFVICWHVARRSRAKRHIVQQFSAYLSELH